MADIIDRRSSRSASSGDSTSVEAKITKDFTKTELGNPRVREVSKGARTFSEFFHPDKQRREVTRGEFLNLMAMIEYQRRETRWYRRIWRFLMGDPQVVSLIPGLVRAHEKTLADAKKSLLEQAEEAKKHLAAQRAALEAKDAEAAKHAD